MEKKDTLLEVKGLRSYFFTDEGVVRAVDGVNFEVQRGESLGVVGESGCGKSVTAYSIMQLLPVPKGKIVEGDIFYHKKDGNTVDISRLKPKGNEMRAIRGNEIAMIFQEPMSSLNPVYTIGDQIGEAVQLHQGLSKKDAKAKAQEMLTRVRIAKPELRVNEYPHQLSGGMRQRAMIAMALSCDPNLLIADEPTTALDVTIEAQILKLMKELQREFGMSIIIITHDMGVIGEMADRVIVMYAGKVVEKASAYQIFYEPKHPYSIGLLESIPQIGERKRLSPIRGTVASISHLPKGCYFAPRCPRVMQECREKDPPVFVVGEEHTVKCWLYKENTVVET